MRGARLFLEAASRHGVRRVFGIVGGEASHITFDEVPEIEFLLTRNEVTAGLMADAYARLTGLPQICYSTFGPGMTNLATGVASSCLDRSPMIAVAAQVDREDIIYNHTHQCLDSVSIMRPMTKFAHELMAAEEIPSIVAEAARCARAEIPGPSFISFPRDVMGEEVPDARARQLLDAMPSSEPAAMASASADELRWLADQLTTAKRPLVLAGNPIFREDATAELAKFVERYQLPVITTLAAKGVLPNEHPLHIGPLNKYLDGILHQPILSQIFDTCDLLLLVGFDYAEDVKPSMWRRGDPMVTISLGSTPNPIEKVFRPEREILGGLKASLQQLSELGRRERCGDLALIESLQQKKLQSGEFPYQTYPTVPPQGIVRSVREAIGPHGILCADIGMHKQYAGLFSATSVPNTFLCSNGLGSFGSGLGFALGAKVARPEVPVVAIVGDGGFHSNSQDLETAVRYRLPIVVVVCKDNAFGLIKYYQISGRNRQTPNEVDFGDVDFVKLAEANGWSGHFVTSRSLLEERLAEALSRNKPTLLEVPVRYQYKF